MSDNLTRLKRLSGRHCVCHTRQHQPARSLLAEWRPLDAPSDQPTTAERPSRCPGDEVVDPDAKERRHA